MIRPPDMMKRTWSALALAAVAGTAQAQPASVTAQYPVRPVRMVLPFPAGGPTDILARLLAQKLAEAWGQNVIIDNRPGGAGVIGTMAAAKSPADGYTLFLGGISTLAIAPFAHRSLPFGPLRDFQPVTQTTRQPIMLMVHPSLPVKSVRQYITLARERPGEINYASSGQSGSGHLAGELFKAVTRVRLVHVPYKGAPPALTDLASGQVQSMFGTMLAAVPLVRAGRIRAIAVTGPKRSVAVPGVPTFGEAGLPGYDASSWNGILVPAGTPRPVVDKLNAALARVLRTPNVLDRLAGDGAVPVWSAPDEFTAFIKAEQAKWGTVVRDANIRVE